MDALLTIEGVKELMSLSKNETEWNANCDKVKSANNGYPKFWYHEIILSGLCNKTLGSGSSDIKINSL